MMGALDRKTVLENLAQNIRLLEDPPPDVIPSSQNVIMAMRDAEELLKADGDMYAFAIQRLKEINKKLDSIGTNPPRMLTWREVTTLPSDQDVWIQEGRDKMFKDKVLYYEIERENMHFYRYSRSGIGYGAYWIVWDKMPTQEQFERVFEAKEKKHAD